MLTVTRRQNARRTPGDSARLTSVELSEKATTTPTTASAPRVFALRARIRVGGAAAVMGVKGSDCEWSSRPTSGRAAAANSSVRFGRHDPSGGGVKGEPAGLHGQLPEGIDRDGHEGVRIRPGGGRSTS